jgi:hypothetical protein
MDIFSTDMLPEDDYRLKKNTRFDEYDTYKLRTSKGFHYQLLSNMLHLNNGNNTFSEIAQYAGVDATDWSWGALIFDLNNDGWKDIVVCNGMYLDVTDNDYVDFFADDNRSAFNREGTNANAYQMLKKMTISVPIPNYAFVNNKDLTFKNESYNLGLGEPGFSNGGAYADFDNDGDIDLIINNLNSPSFIYKNNTSEEFKKSYLRVKLRGIGANTFGVGASVKLYAKGFCQTLQNFPTRGFQSAIEPVLSFGLDTVTSIDSLVVLWPDFKIQRLYNVPANKTITLKQSDAAGQFIYQPQAEEVLFLDVTRQAIAGNTMHKENLFVDFNKERLMPHLLSTQGPAMAVGDVNGDGLDDIIVGGAKHDTTKLFLQTKIKSFRQVLQPAFVKDENYEDAGMELFDADNDGDLDLMIASGGNLDAVGSPLLQPRLYINDGKGSFKKDEIRLPAISVNASCISVEDFNKDGYADVFIGGRSVPGQYGVIPNSYLLQNTKGIFIDVTDYKAPQLKNVGMVTDAVWLDADGDGIKDLVVVGEWMPVTIFKNDKHQLKPSSNSSQFANTNGWWNCIEAADIDGDGDMDFIAGNLGLNTKIKADSLHPAKLYINDFDNNGTTECVLTYYKSDGKSYPYYLKNDITAQMPVLKKKFLKHASYSSKTIEEVFDKNQLDRSQLRIANLFETSLFINMGNGTFKVQPLPDAAQLSPVYAIVAKDVDGDSVKDILLGGNFYGLKPELGKYDASYGVLLKGTKPGAFISLPVQQSGLCVRGEVRDMKWVEAAGTLFISKSDGPLQLYRRN